MNLWQLKRLSDGEPLNEPQPLPENWASIFGLANLGEKLHDLSWIGPSYTDMGWFIVGEIPDAPAPTDEEIMWEKAKGLLRNTDWTMMPDVPMTSDTRRAWEDWRRFVREIRSHPDFPNVAIPAAPE